MADFNDIKKIAAQKANEIAGKTKIVARGAVDKTKTAAKITKLKAEISGEKDAIKKNLMAIGEAFYKMNQENPHEGYEQLFAEVTVSLGIIQAKLDEIETLKLLAEDEEFDEVIEDMKVAVSDVYDTVKNKVVDVYGDIKDRLSDKGDCEVEIVIEKAEKCDECDDCAPAADEGQDTEVELSSQAEKVGREVAEEIKDGLEGKEE